MESGIVEFHDESSDEKTFGGFIAKFAISQSLMVNLLVILLLVFGAVTYLFIIRKQTLPLIKLGIIKIEAINPGSNAKDVETDLTIPIENQIKAVSDIEHIESITTESRSNVFVFLETGADEKKVLLDLKAEIDSLALPKDVETPTVTNLEIMFPVVDISVCVCEGYFEDLTTEQKELKLKAIAEKLKDELLDFIDVQEVSIFGLRERKIYIDVNPLKLSQYNLNLQKLASIIIAANSRLSAGKLEVSREEVLVKTGEKFADNDNSTREIQKIIVRSSPHTSGISLNKIAKVEETLTDQQLKTKIYKLNEEFPGNKFETKNALNVQVFKKEMVDTITLSRVLKNFVNSYKNELPEGVTIEVTNDESKPIIEMLKVIEENALLGFVIVIVVLMLFLNYRIAFMTALGIPISILGTIIIANLMGESANVLSIFGLIIALGLVVDDAIIICENSYRHIEKGLKPRQAAIKGVSEVAAPVIAAVLTTIAAFAPILFISGIFGQFMRLLPTMVILALLISLVEAFIVLPVHVKEWAPKVSSKGIARKSKNFPGLIFDFLFSWAEYPRFYVQNLLDSFRKNYLLILKRALKYRYLFVVFMLGLMIFAGFLFMQMDKGFMANQRVDSMGVRLELPKGSSLEKTEKTLQQIEKEIFKVIPRNGIDSLTTTIGKKAQANRSYLFGKNVGEINIRFTSEDDYEKILGKDAPEDFKSDENVNKYQNELRRRLLNLYAKKIEVVKFESGPPTGKAIEFRIRGEETEVLQELSDKIKNRLQNIKGVYDVNDDIEVGNEEIQFRVDCEKAHSLGMDELYIASYVRNAFDGLIVSKITIGEDDVDVVLRFEEKYRKTLNDLLYLNVSTPSGANIPLKSLVKVSRTTGTAAIKRYNRKRTVTIFGDVAGISSEKGSKESKKIAEEILKDYPGYSILVTGQVKEQQKSFKDLGIAMLLAVFLIFIILASVLRSLAQPLMIMTVVPFGMVGAIFGLFITGTMFTLNAGLGAIALMGIVVNDSTVLVVFINKQRRIGVNKWRAVLTAAKIRLRPILLTTITTIGGLIGIAVGLGTKTFLADMAISIISGLLFATILTLGLIPVLYVIYEDFLKIFKRQNYSMETETKTDSQDAELAIKEIEDLRKQLDSKPSKTDIQTILDKLDEKDADDLNSDNFEI